MGMDTQQVVARFESERQALALMNNPHIARVFDAGATPEGRPYFVMEYIAGIPIQEYCDTHRLITRERLELFVEVCDGVQHAHQKGIIHRDIKSSNVLVAIQNDKPIPKIIDFGVAKATARPLTDRAVFTELGQLIGTPEYMSPEQVEMSGLDIDTRTDIYSLGVLLYELLVGVLPFESAKLRSGSYEEIRRRVREIEPPKPSTRLNTGDSDTTQAAEKRRTDLPALVRQLKGELDWITMKAMAKDRTHRYASASELAADIGRHLRHEPVLAGPPGLTYRLRKFILRHRAGVVAGALIFLALIAGIAGTTVGLLRARKAERIAQEESAKATAINAFLLDTLGSANPVEGKGRDVTVLEALKSAAEKIAQAFPDQPRVEGEVRTVIGITYLRLGRYEEAEELLRAAVKILDGTPGDPQGLVSALNSLGILRQERGDLKEAESLQSRALSILREKKGDLDQDVLSIQSNLALLYQDMGSYEEAAKLMRQTLESDRRLWGNEHVSVAMDLNNLGNLLLKKGDYQESEPLLREAVDILKKQDRPELSIVMGNLGDLITRKGDPAAAESIFAEARTMGLRVFGDQNQDVAKLRSKYGGCLIQLKKYDQAEGELLAAFPVLRDSLGVQNEATQVVIARLIELYEAWGKEEKASQYRVLLSSEN
jgi:Tfp pilus assembly protein PilF